MGYFAMRSQKVQLLDEDGAPLQPPQLEQREPGDAIPEADYWPNAEAYVKAGWIRHDGKGEPLARGLVHKKLEPMRASTPEDIARDKEPVTAKVAFGLVDPKEEPVVPAGNAELREKLEARTKKDLMRIAKELGLSVSKEETKATFVDAILAADLAEGQQALANDGEPAGDDDAAGEEEDLEGEDDDVDLDGEDEEEQDEETEEE